MKLLKLEIGDLPKEKQFRSLHAGFKVEFHTLDAKGQKAMESFSPFCFAGINGSGKSNVLEALSVIFFHLECCVAKFKPKTFEKHFRPEVCSLDAFTLEYLIGHPQSTKYILEGFDKITIKKEQGKAPIMQRQPLPFISENEVFDVSLEPRFDTTFPQAAEGKACLPDIVVGYSSGENEILSLPFRKSRLINFDKYREDFIKSYNYEEPENSLIYIDEEMSQAVLLACLLFEDEATLKPLRKELGIVGLRSFRMNLSSQHSSTDNELPISFPILNHIKDEITALKNCSTSWFCEKYDDDEEGLTKPSSILTLDFFVDESTKSVFKKYFNSSFELFRFFQVLYELNANIVSEYSKEEVYKSKGFYTNGKAPEGSPEDKVFYFLDYLILKEIEGETQPKELLLREFSDGEHQFLHTIGICLMLKNRRSLLLLDEPETHFNPSWRARFIKILNESIKASNPKGVNVHLLKDIILTSHSPFIISDCMPDNVIFFNKENEDKKLVAKKASDMGFNTYGSSVDFILKNFYNTDLISSKSSDELKEVLENGTIEELRNAVDYFGESSKKQFLFRKIYEKTEIEDDN